MLKTAWLPILDWYVGLACCLALSAKIVGTHADILPFDYIDCLGRDLACQLNAVLPIVGFGNM
jgi:hypothetical protein